MKIKDIFKKDMYRKVTLKYVLFVNMLVWLSCPIWHNFIFIFDFKDLYGVQKNKVGASFNLKNWFSADIQTSLEEFAIYNNPLSPLFIKISNQIEYSLFNNTLIIKCVFGKEKYLFEEGYVNSFYGKDYIGEDALRKYVEKMKFVQDTLEKLHKQFIYLQAPGKPRFYPEFLQDTIISIHVPTNYDVLSKLLLEYKINHIDFTPYLLGLKNKSAYPLFTQTGIHWSKYCCVLAMDSVNHFIESTMKIDLPDIKIESIEEDYPRFDDADLESVANLLYPINNIKYGYPNYKFESTKNKDTPFVTLIGDSYFSGLFLSDWFNSFNPVSQHWFYNRIIFKSDKKNKLHKYQLNQNEIIIKSDIIIVGCTEHNIKSRSWGFIDDMYDYYKCGTLVIDNQERLSYMKRVDSCKVTMTEADINKADMYLKSQHVTLDSAKTIFCIWKLNKGEY